MSTLDYHDGRTLALMIARTYAHGAIALSCIGTTWSPQIAPGRHWTEKRCRRVLQQLVDAGLVIIYEGFTGYQCRTTERAFKFFEIAGAPAISDADADRFYLSVALKPGTVL